MTVSAISQATSEGQALFLSSFKKAGRVYLVWTTSTNSINQAIWWKPHDSTTYAEIPGEIVAPYRNISAAYSATDDAVVVAYDDATIEDSVSDSSMYVARFAATTGKALTPAVKLGRGMKASLIYRGGVDGPILELIYTSRKQKSAYIRESLDGGVTWSGERPVLTNYVRDSIDVVAVPFDDEHISIAQLGADARPMREMASYLRTRPLVSIVPHPSVANQVFVAEPTWYSAAYFSDYLRGALRLSRDGSKIYWLDGVRLGVDDTIHELGLFSVARTSVSLVTSFHNSNVDAGLSDNLVSFTVSPLAQGPVVDCFGFPSSVPAGIDFDVSNDYAYVAGTKEIAPQTNGGAFDIVQLSDMTSSRVIAPNSTIFGRAVAVGMVPSGAHCIFFATNESGQERLRIYTESGLTPSLIATHKLPSRVNKLHAVMTDATHGLVYVSMADRLNVYKVSGLDQPIRLVTTIPILTRGSFFQAFPISNGNIVAAMGAGGVGVFTADGGTLSELPLSGVHASPWAAFKTRAVGDVVAPTDKSLFAAQRKYFKCITAGTSAAVEPLWAPATYGNVTDGTAVWQDGGLVDAIVTGIAVDQTRSRIMAVGLVGGATATQGRVYNISAPTLVPGLTVVATPVHSLAAGTYTTAQNVTLSCATTGASIYYTLDGTTPTDSSTPYASPIPLSVDGAYRIRAIAYASGKTESDPSDVNYTIDFPQVTTPTGTITGGGGALITSVILECTTVGAQIRYTLDGSTPTSGSTLYTGAFNPNTAVISLKAAAFKTGMKPSAVYSYSMAAKPPVTVTGLQLLFDAASVAGSTIYDMSGNGRHGTIIGPLASALGGGSLLFDAALGTKVSAPLVSNATSNMTMQAWVYVTLGRGGCFMSMGGGANGYGIGQGTSNFDTAGNYICGINSSVAWISGNTVTAGWHLLTYCLTNISQVRMYVDTTQIAWVGSTPIAPAGNFWLGSEGGGGRFSSCNIAMAMVYNREISAAEVTANYNATKSRFGL